MTSEWVGILIKPDSTNDKETRKSKSEEVKEGVNIAKLRI